MQVEVRCSSNGHTASSHAMYRPGVHYFGTMIELKRDGIIFCWKMIFRLLIVHNGFLECVSIYAQEL